MKEVYDVVRTGENFVNVNNGSFEVQEVIIFDPYASLYKNLVETILNKKYSDDKVSDDVMRYLADHFCDVQYHEIFIGIFGISVSALSSKFLEPVHRFLEILKHWRSNTEGTFIELRKIFSSISIFATQSGMFTSHT